MLKIEHKTQINKKIQIKLKNTHQKNFPNFGKFEKTGFSCEFHFVRFSFELLMIEKENT